ncbi:MAG: RNA pseudouridine synthase [Balneolaceae bacterium]|nr:RNA pseudouridine synthase [Balneolaceae bacterium]
MDKPHDVLSQEDQTGDPDVLTLCKEYLQQKKGTKNTPYLGLVHRLDRPVGGLMLLAKNPKAAAKLSEQLRDRTIRKTYHAVVQGHPPQNGFLTHHLVKNREENIVEITLPQNSAGKEAQLTFQKLSQRQDLALLAVHLQTGRPHQIKSAAGGGELSRLGRLRIWRAATGRPNHGAASGRACVLIIPPKIMMWSLA